MILRPTIEHVESSPSRVPKTRSPAGMVSVTTTLRAVDGPALETLSLKTTSSPTSAVELETLFTTLTSVSTTTGVVTVSALSASLGSRVGEETDAVLVRVPRAPPATVALMVIRAVCPSASEPSRHSTVWSDLIGWQVPTVVDTDGSSRCSSSRSVTLTPVAANGPTLCTVTVYVTRLPATGARGLTDFTRVRSALGPVEVVTVSVLSAGSGSGVGLATVAVLVTAPSWSPSSRATTVIVTGSAPGSTGPSEHRSVLSAPTASQLPAVVVAVAPLSSTSSTSSTVTSVAVDGPSLSTVSV